MLVHELFTEAVENNYIMKNPARRVVLPRCRPIREVQPLSETQVSTLFETTEGRDHLMWRVLLLTGVRISELFALRKADLVPAGLCVDESSDRGRLSTTKNKKTRYAPIPASLRTELEAWNKTVEGDPRDRQAILGHYSEEFTARVYQKPIARQQASIEDLDSRYAGKVVTMPVRESA